MPYFTDAEDDIPSGIPQSRSTPAGNLGDSLSPTSGTIRRNRRSGTKRCSFLGTAGLPLGFMSPFNIQLPQLDGIQRSQKVLDMRLQSLQVSISGFRSITYGKLHPSTIRDGRKVNKYVWFNIWVSNVSVRF